MCAGCPCATGSSASPTSSASFRVSGPAMTSTAHRLQPVRFSRSGPPARGCTTPSCSTSEAQAGDSKNTTASRSPPPTPPANLHNRQTEPTPRDANSTDRSIATPADRSQPCRPATASCANTAAPECPPTDAPSRPVPQRGSRDRSDGSALKANLLPVCLARPVGAGNSAVVVGLPRWGPMLSPRVPNLVPIPGPRMERETPGQRPRPNYGHPQDKRDLRRSQMCSTAISNDAAPLWECLFAEVRQL